MIDVMLVLLIIFMIATPLIVQGFPVTLPRAASPDPDPEHPDKDMVVGLDVDGHLYLDGQAVADDALRGYLASAFSEVSRSAALSQG
jgi:biopolymer transport protein TolR